MVNHRFWLISRENGVQYSAYNCYIQGRNGLIVVPKLCLCLSFSFSLSLQNNYNHMTSVISVLLWVDDGIGEVLVVAWLCAAAGIPSSTSTWYCVKANSCDCVSLPHLCQTYWSRVSCLCLTDYTVHFFKCFDTYIMFWFG